MDWSAVFGDKDSLTQAELEAALGSRKLVDLAEGGYVAKEKFDKAQQVAKDRERELTDQVAKLQAATDGEDGLAKQVEALTAQLAQVRDAQTAAEAKAVRLEREKMVTAKVASPKLAKLALIEAEGMVSDEVDFEAALAKVLEDPDYATDGDQGTQQPVGRVRTGDQHKGSSEEELAAAAAGFAAAAGVPATQKE